MIIKSKCNKVTHFLCTYRAYSNFPLIYQNCVWPKESQTVIPDQI